MHCHVAGTLSNQTATTTTTTTTIHLCWIAQCSCPEGHIKVQQTGKGDSTVPNAAVPRLRLARLSWGGGGGGGGGDGGGG